MVEFFGLDFEVREGIFSPRPETETVVEVALKFAGKLVADVGTGTGCIGIILAKLTESFVVATDIDMHALEVAKKNACRHGVEKRFFPVLANILEGIKSSFDLVVSNPPYVPSAVRVSTGEKDIALYGGEKGYEFTIELIRQAYYVLKRGGHIVVEVGFDDLKFFGIDGVYIKSAIENALRKSGFSEPEYVNDLIGVARCFKATKLR